MRQPDDLHDPAAAHADGAPTDSRPCGCVSEDDQYRLRLALEDALARRCSALAIEDRQGARTYAIAAQKLRWRLAEAMGRAATYTHHEDCPHRTEPRRHVADL